MLPLEEILLKRFVRKGLEVHLIPAYLRDLSNTLESYPHSTTNEINTKLKAIGWYNFDLDEHTFQQIIALQSSEGCKAANQQYSCLPESHVPGILSILKPLNRAKEANDESSAQSGPQARET